MKGVATTPARPAAREEEDLGPLRELSIETTLGLDTLDDQEDA